MRINLPVSGRDFPVPDGQTLVSVTDLKGRIVYCNPNFAAVSGYAQHELLGQAHNLVRHPDMPAEAFRDMWDTLHSGLPWTALVKNRRKDGDHYWVRANATPMKDGERVVGYLSVRTRPDAGEVAQAEPLYAQMRQEAEAGVLRTILHRGRVVRTDPLGRASAALSGLPAWLGADGALTAGLLALTGAAASIWTPQWWLPLAAMAWLAAHGFGRHLRSRSQKHLLADMQLMAAGDLTQAVHVGGRGIEADMQLALAQLNINLRTLLSDARDEVENVRVATSEIAAGNRDLSSRTESQAATLEQTAASMEQIHSTVKHSAASAVQGARLAAETSILAQRSHEGVQGVVQAMEGITLSSRRIGDIIQVIEGVAFQTNILALNAAVEAARAGEAGRGFAVVASEVRTLSQRTAEAARQVRQLIEESGARVESGGHHTASAQARVQEVLASVGQVNVLLDQISNAAIEQQSGVAQVNTAVTELDRITQQNAAMVEQLSASADSLDGQMAAITCSLQLFRLHEGEASLAESDAVALRREGRRSAAATRA